MRGVYWPLPKTRLRTLYSLPDPRLHGALLADHFDLILGKFITKTRKYENTKISLSTRLMFVRAFVLSGFRDCSCLFSPRLPSIPLSSPPPPGEVFPPAARKNAAHGCASRAMNGPSARASVPSNRNSIIFRPQDDSPASMLSNTSRAIATSTGEGPGSGICSSSSGGSCSTRLPRRRRISPCGGAAVPHRPPCCSRSSLAAQPVARGLSNCSPSPCRRTEGTPDLLQEIRRVDLRQASQFRLRACCTAERTTLPYLITISSAASSQPALKRAISKEKSSSIVLMFRPWDPLFFKNLGVVRHN